MSEREPARPATTDDESPPILGSWPRLYTLVLLVLAALIAALWVLTRAFA